MSPGYMPAGRLVTIQDARDVWRGAAVSRSITRQHLHTHTHTHRRPHSTNRTHTSSGVCDDEPFRREQSRPARQRRGVKIASAHVPDVPAPSPAKAASHALPSQRPATAHAAPSPREPGTTSPARQQLHPPPKKQPAGCAAKLESAPLSKVIVVRNLRRWRDAPLSALGQQRL